ncbi:MAG: UvrB/UvrC motif-containing protein, partial [Gammaproteobacteria bacterium]|nr:UvrB/UvrC motif-containing protein [Gammaproteobacteria bacterium]
HGRAILYADSITKSMARAIAETDRRREKQLQFNAAHGITPRGIVKPVSDMIEGVYRRNVQPAAHAAEKNADYRVLRDPQAVAKKIKELEEAMYRHARNLEFEQAAALRDDIKKLETRLLGTDLPVSLEED